MRDTNGHQRQPGSFRLGLEQSGSHGVHRDAIGRLVDRRQQRAGFAESVAADDVQHPGAVFATAPRNQDFHSRLI